MTIRECDACSIRLAPDECGERLVFNGGPKHGGFEYDLCDKCGSRLFAILTGKEWKVYTVMAGVQLTGTDNSGSPDALKEPKAKE